MLFFKNNFFNILTVISLLFAVWAYSSSIQKPLLQMSSEANKSVIVTPDSTKNLKAYYNEEKITKGLFYSTVVIWNAGNNNLKPNLIHKNLELIIKPKDVKIYDVILEKKTRDAISFKIGDNEKNVNSVPISFNILEKKDGVLIRVFHSYDEDISFNMSGNVEDQKEEFKYDKEIKEVIFPSNHLIMEGIISLIMGFSLLFIPAIMIIRICHIKEKVNIKSIVNEIGWFYFLASIFIAFGSIMNFYFAYDFISLYFSSPYASAPFK